MEVQQDLAADQQGVAHKLRVPSWLRLLLFLPAPVLEPVVTGGLLEEELERPVRPSPEPDSGDGPRVKGDSRLGVGPDPDKYPGPPPPSCFPPSGEKRGPGGVWCVWRRPTYVCADTTAGRLKKEGGEGEGERERGRRESGRVGFLRPSSVGNEIIRNPLRRFDRGESLGLFRSTEPGHTFRVPQGLPSRSTRPHPPHPPDLSHPPATGGTSVHGTRTTGL